MPRYVEALKKELNSGLPKRFDTVFIGGGTPTALPLKLLVEIIETVQNRVDGELEFTVEVNPASIDGRGLAELRRAGVNRLSIGLQSASGDELQTLGRIHTLEDFRRTFGGAREAGFGNINVDLMFSLPGQTVESFEETLSAVTKLRPEHISCYSLILEEGTPLYDMSPALPSEDEDRRMYRYCAERLRGEGYGHYEISNFALPGFECRHNLKYWELAPYSGFGAGAHSFDGAARYENTKSPAEYIENNRASVTLLDGAELESEYIFLGLRKTRGICLNDYSRRFGADFKEKYRHIIERYAGFLIVGDGRVFLTPDGLDISNSIMCEFV